VDGFVERRANAKRAHARLQFSVKLFGNAFLNQQARTGAADLALVEPDAVYESFHRGIEVGVFENDEGRFAAEFEGKFFVGLRSSAADGASDFGRSGEGNFIDIRVFDKSFTGRPVARDDINHTRW